MQLNIFIVDINAAAGILGGLLVQAEELSLYRLCAF